MDFLNKEESNGTLIDFIKNRKKQFNGNSDEGTTQKQQILEELHVSIRNNRKFFLLQKYIFFELYIIFGRTLLADSRTYQLKQNFSFDAKHICTNFAFTIC